LCVKGCLRDYVGITTGLPVKLLALPDEMIE